MSRQDAPMLDNEAILIQKACPSNIHAPQTCRCRQYRSLCLTNPTKAYRPLHCLQESECNHPCTCFEGSKLPLHTPIHWFTGRTLVQPLQSVWAGCCPSLPLTSWIGKGTAGTVTAGTDRAFAKQLQAERHTNNILARQYAPALPPRLVSLVFQRMPPLSRKQGEYLFGACCCSTPFTDARRRDEIDAYAACERPPVFSHASRT